MDSIGSTAASRSIAAISPGAAHLSLASAAIFLALVALLHVLRPDLDPSWRFISEYALGESGWMMALAFVSFGVSYVSLFASIRSQVSTRAGRVGLFFLLVSAAGLFLAAAFPMDPIDTDPAAATASGALHNLAGALGMAMPAGAALVSWGLARNPVWTDVRRPLFGTAGLAVLSAVAFTVVLIATLPPDGAFGPGVPVGWPNRLEVLANSAWVMTAAWHAIQLRR